MSTLSPPKLPLHASDSLSRLGYKVHASQSATSTAHVCCDLPLLHRFLTLHTCCRLKSLQQFPRDLHPSRRLKRHSHPSLLLEVGHLRLRLACLEEQKNLCQYPELHPRECSPGLCWRVSSFLTSDHHRSACYSYYTLPNWITLQSSDVVCQLRKGKVQRGAWTSCSADFVDRADLIVKPMCAVIKAVSPSVPLSVHLRILPCAVFSQWAFVPCTDGVLC